MSEFELQRGRIYRAKKPRSVYHGADVYYNDRQILWIGLDEVQYDSPSVGIGSHYKKATKDAFLKWAGKDVTEEVPEGEWAKVPSRARA